MECSIPIAYAIIAIPRRRKNNQGKQSKSNILDSMYADKAEMTLQCKEKNT